MKIHGFENKLDANTLAIHGSEKKLDLVGMLLPNGIF